MKNNDKNILLTDEKINDLAHKIMLNPSKEAIELLKKDFIELNKMMNLIEKIDVSNIEPLSRIENYEELQLRDDIAENQQKNKNIILENATEKTSDFITLTKVIKNDK
ncbi:hypothetical protein [Mesomycoplasma neurolyticum]|uniref:Glutamyl-tRNA amidotransferase subunit C n=1 Tax=Mesomycoplasma neurolyticum TaxID=2120 RepID=A0A449A611_9BACT|nr:hypothetical protein [Mesomycoplasma neurolyticum]VEU59676.1 glutamyl-tRNA amidotransferase subunit C [Mesomycoplasma neurolyticum]